MLLRGKPLKQKKLLAFFESAGFDAATLPGVNFDQAMAAFAAAFQLAATDEPELQGTIKTNQALAQTHLQREMLKTLRGLVEFLQNSRLNTIRIQHGEVSAQPQAGKARAVYHLNLNKQIVVHDGNFRNSNVFTSENTKIIKAKTYIEKVEEQTAAGPNVSEKRNIEIPFVIFAMTENEASNLISGQAFSHELATQGDLPRFNRLLEIIAEHGNIKDISKLYASTREEWKPPFIHTSNIRETIEDVVERFNSLRSSENSNLRLKPIFRSTDFFSDNENWRRNLWNDFYYKGGVIVVDAISICHPILREKLVKFQSGPLERTSIIALSPINRAEFPLTKILEEEIWQYLNWPFEKFSCEFDKLFEFDVTNVRQLQRWFFSILPDAAITIQGHKIHPIYSNKWKEAGKQHNIQQRGMGQKIFNRGL